MPENSDSNGENGQNSRKFSIELPQTSGSNSPHVVVWGTFRGLKEDIAGAVYAEVAPDDTDFQKFGLALFSDPANLRDFNLSSSPVDFYRKVEKRYGPHDDLKKSDMNMAYDTFENYLLDHSKKDDFLEWLENKNNKELVDFFDQLVTSIVRKGKIKFDISAKLFTPGELEEKETDSSKEEPEESSGEESESSTEEERNYHRVSIVTIPMKGVKPNELQPGDEIHSRAVGKVAQKFSDSLQSDKYDEATVPLEASVEAISMDPQLPADHDGDSADYIEIKVKLENGIYGKGYVYRAETVKTVRDSENGEDSDIMFIVVLFIASGFALMFLALAAWVIFG